MKTINVSALSVACFCMFIQNVISETITVSSYPSLGNPGSVLGKVTSLNPTKYEVAIVIDVFGTYWSKPHESAPFVTIDRSGNFNAVFNTDGNDIYAEKIYLFLVPTNSVIPLVLGGGSIPTDLYSLAVATVVVDRTHAGNHIVWSGRNWTIKDTYGTFWGPGNNYFSASSVHVDAGDKLHLTVHHESNHWRCAEIILNESLGYGSYRFYVDSILTNLPSPIVLGMFTYDDDADYTHREIDVEFSNGDVVGSNAPLQYVIQPYQAADQRHRFVPPWGLKVSTYAFSWLPGFVSFNSYTNRQSFVDSFTVAHMIQYNARSFDSMFFATRWTDMSNVVARAMYPTNMIVKEEPRTYWFNPYRFFRTKMTALYETGTNSSFEHWGTDAGVPPKGNEKVHINLWLYNANAPGNTNQSFEVVLSGFEYRAPTFTSQSLRPKLQVLKVDDPQGLAITTLQVTIPGN